MGLNLPVWWHKVFIVCTAPQFQPPPAAFPPGCAAKQQPCRRVPRAGRPPQLVQHRPVPAYPYQSLTRCLRAPAATMRGVPIANLRLSPFRLGRLRTRTRTTTANSQSSRWALRRLRRLPQHRHLQSRSSAQAHRWQRSRSGHSIEEHRWQGSCAALVPAPSAPSKRSGVGMA